MRCSLRSEMALCQASKAARKHRLRSVARGGEALLREDISRMLATNPAHRQPRVQHAPPGRWPQIYATASTPHAGRCTCGGSSQPPPSSNHSTQHAQTDYTKKHAAQIDAHPQAPVECPPRLPAPQQHARLAMSARTHTLQRGARPCSPPLKAAPERCDRVHT